MYRKHAPALPTVPTLRSSDSERQQPSGHDKPASTRTIASDAGAATVDVLDVPAVARLLAVGRNTVYALVARNRIPHRRIGRLIRFHRDAVMRWLNSCCLQDAKERQ
jgi:excisionase family DNA binding protein